MHIHILGICGTFMGGLAALAREAGHRVTGCDAGVYPPMSEQLRALGIDLIEGFAADQLALPDGTPIFENLRGLPDDWFAYVASLPGLAVGDVEPMSVGGIDGDGATYSVGDVPEAPLATCLDGVMSWVERTGGWCFSEQESGTLLITEIGGNRYELNVGTANDVAAADRSALDAMIASLVLV